MFDFDRAIERAREACEILFFGDEAVEALLSELADPATPEPHKKRLLVNLGILAGEPFIGPQIVMLDLVGRCNLNCTFCRDHSPYLKHKREAWRDMEMDYALAVRLIDEAVRGGASLIPLLGAGEPLLYSRFDDIVQQIKPLPVDFEIFTNGLLLNRDKAQRLADASRGRVHFSISAATEDTYRKFRPFTREGQLSRVEENIATLASLRKPGLRIGTVQVLNPFNYRELLPMIDQAVRLGVDEVEYKICEVEDFSQNLRFSPEQFEQIRQELRHAEELAAVGGVEIHDNIYLQLERLSPQTGTFTEDPFDTIGCHLGFELVRIRRDGEVSFCCALKFIDNVRDQSLQSYWRGEPMQRARIAARDFPKGTNTLIAPKHLLRDAQCRSCFNYILNFHSQEEMRKLGLR